MMQRDLALELIRRRPFKSWESLKQAFGVDEEFARLWRNNGAVLGLPQQLSTASLSKRKRRKFVMS
jgi:hypothetical protein